jgi:2-keto-4-pentenoate hydratase/2-oxohepta-3-ene-1,7-dioic acid hydratase in catechol pathway
MKLATFVANGRERFGIVAKHPATGELWIFDPEAVEKLLKLYASAPTSPYSASHPHFLPSRPWPEDLAAFLALGDQAMSAIRRLHDFLLRFLEQADQCLMAAAGYPLDAVKLHAPIPRPRFYFGLVQNSPTFWRNDLAREVVNIYPQGHARPQGTVTGHGEPVFVPPASGGFGWNPEPGFIIGRGGRNIPVESAIDHVAGMTVVLDVSSRYYHRLFQEQSSNPNDWFADATASWLGKKTDTFCPMGPFLTTMDEIGNPYDLLIYTRQSGWLRDRSHTNSMLIGIERLIAWLSSFMTLYPGDVLHMATMGVDGMRITPEMHFGPHDYLEGEIERVGVLRAPVVLTNKADWRSEDDPGRTIHPAPAVRDLIRKGDTTLNASSMWSPEKVRHFWTVYGNYQTAPMREGIAYCEWPRVLNGPARALGVSGSAIRIPPRAHTLHFGPELAFVVGRLARNVQEEEAEGYILGYIALASIFDTSFATPLCEPATPQERNMPAVYGRWADGFNTVSATPLPLAPEAIRGRRMQLSIEGYGEITTTTDAYLHLAPRILSFLSGQITLFPGDVVTLGRVAELLAVPAGSLLRSGTVLQAAVEGIGEIASPIVDERKPHASE